LIDYTFGTRRLQRGPQQRERRVGVQIDAVGCDAGQRHPHRVQVIYGHRDGMRDPLADVVRVGALVVRPQRGAILD